MNTSGLGPAAYEREHERELEEQQHMQRAMQQEDLAQREREHNERQERERQQREQYQPAPAHQNNTGSIHLHQPVANRLPNAIHSPGGLLANHGGAPPQPSQTALGAPSGPGNAFGGPLHSDGNRPFQHGAQPTAAQQQLLNSGLLLQHAAQHSVGMNGPGGPPSALNMHQLQQHQDAARLMPFGGPMTPHQMPGLPVSQNGQPGQQPILNVSPTKYQFRAFFSEHPVPVYHIYVIPRIIRSNCVYRML